jgi:hypothetical protein
MGRLDDIVWLGQQGEQLWVALNFVSACTARATSPVTNLSSTTQ